MRRHIISRRFKLTNRRVRGSRGIRYSCSFRFSKRGTDVIDSSADMKSRGIVNGSKVGEVMDMFSRMMVVVVLAVSMIGCARQQGSNQNANSNKSAAAAMEARDAEGNTALLRAVNSGDTFEVRRLVEAGADVNAASTSGVTPLMNAGGMGNKEVVELLIKKGANVNHRTPGNYTPLMTAALVGQIEIVKMLLDAGADPSVKDTGGRTAADYAAEHKHDDIAQLLKQRMPSNSAGKK